MRIYSIFILFIVILLVGCNNVKTESNTDSQFSCEKNSDCVSATEIGCYIANNGHAGYDICPSVNKNNFKPKCLETDTCREPWKIICGKGVCKSIECEKDSDCLSATKVGCYVECNPNEGRDCSLNDLCPAITKNTFEPACTKPFVCREPSKIICENNKCKSIE